MIEENGGSFELGEIKNENSNFETGKRDSTGTRDDDPDLKTISPSKSNSWIVICLALFIVAGFFEIVGGWFVWKYRRGGQPFWWAIIGAIVLTLYGFIPTWQPTEAGEFGRVYAGYGAYFIVLSLLWAWAVDKQKPDVGDLIGSAFAIVGAAVITFWPRT
jgi:small multidrug resistance family-3 protein